MTDTEQARAAVEKAFREGYSAGYRNGGSDQCSYEWGCGSKHDQTLKREQDQEWEESDAYKRCPKCGGDNTDKRHIEGSFYICETNWMQCEDCEEQWGHQ